MIILQSQKALQNGEYCNAFSAISWLGNFLSYNKKFILLFIPLPIYVVIALFFRKDIGICTYHLIQIPVIYIFLVIGHKILISRFIKILTGKSKIWTIIRVLCVLSFVLYMFFMLTKHTESSGETAAIEFVFSFASYFLGAKAIIKRNPINSNSCLGDTEGFSINNIIHDDNYYIRSKKYLIQRNKTLKRLGIDLCQQYDAYDLVPASVVLNVLKIVSPECTPEHLIRKLRSDGIIRPYKSKYSSKFSGKYYTNSVVEYINSLV